MYQLSKTNWAKLIYFSLILREREEKSPQIFRTKANVQKADSVEIYGPEDLEDYTDHGRTGSYDLDHRDLDQRGLDQRDLDHQLVDHIQRRTRRESIASIFTISKNELKRVPSLVNLEAHKVCALYIQSCAKEYRKFGLYVVKWP